MVQLYGQKLTKREVDARAGLMSQFAGVRLTTLADGVERGVRLLEFRTGAGLRFTVVIDRAFDIGECEFRGQAIGWQSPTGFRHPGLIDYEGEAGLAFTRAFSGLLVTCGLDHALGPCEAPADNYGYPGRKSIKHSLHGRLTTIPAQLSGYGESWRDDECVLWAEGIVRQSAMFAEDLHLHRRIETDVGGAEIRIFDRVVNHGFRPTPHMFFYHVNVGYPLLDEGARYLAPIEEVVFAAHAGEAYRRQGVGYRRCPGPSDDFVEQVWQHECAPDASGATHVALVNDRLRLGFQVTTLKAQLPCLYQWQDFQSGHYALGIEPSTHHVLGEPFARERDEMIWLKHDEERRYEARFRVLDGAGEIAAAEARIAKAAKQPDEDFPEPSGRFKALR